MFNLVLNYIKIFSIVVPLVQIWGQHRIFLYISQTKLNIYQKLRDHIEQIKISETTLYIKAKFMDHIEYYIKVWELY